jgi:hypothetical protein
VRQRPSILISRDMGLGINPKLMWWSTFYFYNRLGLGLRVNG